MIACPSTLAAALPGEAYLFGKSVVWVMFWLIIAAFLRDEGKALIKALTNLLERLLEFNFGDKIRITIQPVEPEATSVQKIEEGLEEKDITRDIQMLL